MKTQQDTRVRMVALENLKAMCERLSAMCHRYWIESVSKHRVCVGYSNPDEYGNERPMYVEFPCYPSSFPDDKGNPRVVLEIIRVIHDNWDGYGWQAFDVLSDGPVLWRNPGSGEWLAESEDHGMKLRLMMSEEERKITGK